MTPAFSLGKRIATARARKGWNQSDLAAELGLCRTAVTHYESDRRNPKVATLKRIASLLGVDVRELLGVLPKKAR